jgi:hypothetical protein
MTVGGARPTSCASTTSRGSRDPPAVVRLVIEFVEAAARARADLPRAIPGAAEKAAARALNAAAAGREAAVTAIVERYAVQRRRHPREDHADDGDAGQALGVGWSRGRARSRSATSRTRRSTIGTGGPGTPVLRAEVLRGQERAIGGAFIAPINGKPRIMIRTGGTTKTGRTQIKSVYTVPIASMLGAESVRRRRRGSRRRRCSTSSSARRSIASSGRARMSDRADAAIPRCRRRRARHAGRRCTARSRRGWRSWPRLPAARDEGPRRPRAPTVIDGWLPPKTGADVEVSSRSCSCARARATTRAGRRSERDRRVDIVIGTYSDTDDGWLDVLLLIDAIRADLGAEPAIAGTAFEHFGPLTWEIPEAAAAAVARHRQNELERCRAPTGRGAQPRGGLRWVTAFRQ